MSDRPSALQIVQLGIEGTAGTRAAATRRLRTTVWTVTPQADIDEIKASGHLFNTLTALNREWTTAAMTMEPDFNEIIYPLASVIARPSGGTPTIYGTAAGGTAYQWQFTPTTAAANTLSTFSLEQGDANHAAYFAYGYMTDFTYEVTRQNAGITGNAMGQILTTGTLTAGGTAVADIQRPILPSYVDVYLDDTAATLGTTKLTRDFRLVLNVTNRQGAVWPLDSANASYGLTVEGMDIGIAATLQVGADAAGTALLNTMRQGATKFLRLQAFAGASGTIVASGTFQYGLIWDMALRVNKAPTPGDADGLFVWEFGFVGGHDATWNKAMQVTVMNLMQTF